MNIKVEIINVLSRKSGQKNITGKTKIDSLGIDSLDLMELIMEAETKIGGELPDEVVTSLKNKTVEEVIAELEKVAK